VALTGMPLRVLGMSHTDMRQVSASAEAAGSDEADPLAVGLSVPLGWSEEGESVTTAAEVAVTSAGPGIRAQIAAEPPWWDPAAVAGKGADPAPDTGPGAGRLVAVSIELPEPAG
jgi:hypothetical protein